MDFEQYMRQYVVKILDTRHQLLGTGFWVLAEGYCLTCFHIIAHKGKIPQSLRIEYNKRIVQGTYVPEISNPSQDIAVLKVIEKDYLPVPTVHLGPAHMDTQARLYGYREGFSEGYSITGSLHPGQTLQSVGKVYNFQTIFPDQSSLVGMSGAPVFDPKRNVVVGILYGEEKQGPSVSYVHSLDKVYDYWHALRSQPKPTHENLLDLLLSLMENQFGTLAQAIARAPIDIREQILDFSPYIREKTESFVGRRFLFQEIQAFIGTNPRGYFLLYGDPGIGKSAISAKLVRDHDYTHHFNIRAEGINKASDFLRDICAQLIVVYDLDFTSLPPEATRDSGFLNQLLNRVSKKMGQSGKCVIVVDALDEAEVLRPPSEANVLFLPRVLPQGIFIIATLRREPKEKISLRIDIPEQIERDLRQDEPGNSADITEYIKGQVSNLGIQAYIHRQHIDDKLFLGHMVNKAQGNFIYLRYVLPEIERGYYKDLALDQIPAGLQNYYESHWRRIKQEHGLDWFDYRLPVVLALTVMKKPVSITLIMEYSDVHDKRRVKEVLHNFDQFLYKVEIEYDRYLTTCYRWYHASFFDFIGRKEEVAEEVVDLRKANEKVLNKMLSVMGDTPISNLFQR